MFILGVYRKGSDLNKSCNTLGTVNTREMIKRVQKNGFRSNELFLENLDRSKLRIVNVEGEEVGIRSEGLRYPSLGRFYRKPLTGLDDYRVNEVILSLIYLNPGIDSHGVKLLTEFIIRNYVSVTKNQGEGFIPAIRFEQLAPYIVMQRNTVCPVEFTPKLKYAFFSYNSKLTSEQKRQVGFQASINGTRLAYGKLIHSVANLLVDTAQEGKIITKTATKRRVDAQGGGEFSRSRNTFYKSILPETEALLNVSEQEGLYKSDKVGEKYSRFRGIVEGNPQVSIRGVAVMLGVSHSTVTEFKEYYSLHTTKKVSQ